MQASGKGAYFQPSMTRLYPSRTIQYPPTQFVDFNVDPEKLACYNQKKKRCEGLTDVLYGAFLLAVSAFNGKITNFGIGTCHDIRGYFKEPVTWANLNNWVYLVVSANPDKVNTFGELCTAFRKDFEATVREKDYIKYLLSLPKILGVVSHVVPTGIRAKLTNVGIWKYKKPMTGYWGTLAGNESLNRGDLMIQSCSVVGESGKSPVNQRMKDAPSDLGERGALLVAKMIAFALKICTPSTQIKDAFDEIVQFKQKIE
jgi:hypothetical protein